MILINSNYLPRLTKAVSSNLATANKDGSRFDEANSILSSESRQRASIKYLTEISAVLIVATLILLTLFVLRKKTLMNPVPLFFCQSSDEDFKDDKDKEAKEKLLRP